MAVFRLLIVEDNEEREACFREWLPEDVRIVLARSAGQAIGAIERDAGAVYGGILLDYDLTEQCRTDTDKRLSGRHVVEAICRHVSRDVPILMHSMNLWQSPGMVERLRAEGFEVTRIPMRELTAEDLVRWVDEARGLWEEG